MRNRVFFPQEVFDAWLAEDQMDLQGKELTLRASGRQYRVVDAIRVLMEVTDSQDLYDIVGRVKTVNFLMELGAELLGTSMLIGDSAYDVIPGFLGAPVGSIERHLAARGEADDGSMTDEELLSPLCVRGLD